MGGWVRYLQLQAKAKTGLSGGLLISAAVAVIALIGAVIFLTIAGYVWLSLRYGALNASLIMAGGYFVIAIVAGLSCLIMRRSAVTKARLALAERKHQPWVDPAMLGIGLQLGRNIGWGRLVSVAAAAVLAAGIGREWFGHRATSAEPTDGDQPDER